MKNNRFFILLSITVILVFIASLFSTVNVLADDSTPPASTEEPVVEETNPSDPSTDPPNTETVSEILEQLPQDTDVVVLDENGEALPLASEEAAEIILATDPVWCPIVSGVAALPGDAGCSINFGTPQLLINDIDSSNPATSISSYEQDGIIYFTASPGGSFVLTPGSGSSVDTADYNILKAYNLILQGGWNGLNNGSGYALTGQTDFSTSRVQIGTSGNPWVGNLTLNDLMTNGVSSGNSFTVYTTDGDITLNNVDVNQQTGSGLSTYYTALLDSSNGDISVDNSSFDGNNSGALTRTLGFSADTDGGSITITDTDFTDSHGVFTDNNGATLSAPTITLTNVTSGNNDGNGIAILDATTVSLTTVDSSGNEKNGLWIEADGNITLTDVNVNYNGNSVGESGLFIDTLGTATLTGIMAAYNANHGVEIHSQNGTSDSVSVSDSVFYGNGELGSYEYTNCTLFFCEFVDWYGGSGLYVETAGDISLDQVEAYDNANNGTELYGTAVGNVTIMNSNFYDNGELGFTFGEDCIFTICQYYDDYSGSGLYVETTGDINLSAITANSNFGSGAILGDSCGCILPSNIFVDSSDFNDNDWIGLEAYSAGEIDLINVNANGNGFIGALLDNTYGSGNIFVDPSQFNDNGFFGLFVYSAGDITLIDVTADNNIGGAYLNTSYADGGDATVTCSNFQNNTQGYGIEADLAGVLTLSGVAFGSGNGSGPYSVGGTLFADSTGCTPTPSGGGSSSVIIPVTGGGKITCDGASANVTVKLPTGDFVILPCPLNEYAVVDLTPQEGLPSPLEDDNHFISALTALVIRDNQPVESLDDPMSVFFLIPEGVDTESLAILFWDGTQWVDLGGEVSSDGLHFEVSTELVGTFVLVSK